MTVVEFQVSRVTITTVTKTIYVMVGRIEPNAVSVASALGVLGMASRNKRSAMCCSKESGFGNMPMINRFPARSFWVMLLSSRCTWWRPVTKQTGRRLSSRPMRRRGKHLKPTIEPNENYELDQ